MLDASLADDSDKGGSAPETPFFSPPTRACGFFRVITGFFFSFVQGSPFSKELRCFSKGILPVLNFDSTFPGQVRSWVRNWPDPGPFSSWGGAVEIPLSVPPPQGLFFFVG